MGEASIEEPKEEPNAEPSEGRFDAIMRYVAAGSVLIGGALGLFQYLDTAQKTYRQPLWDRQITVYFEAANAVASGDTQNRPVIDS
jgi:hypothetical protein